MGLPVLPWLNSAREICFLRLLLIADGWLSFRIALLSGAATFPGRGRARTDSTAGEDMIDAQAGN
jgi:hypothetical protein